MECSLAALPFAAGSHTFQPDKPRSLSRCCWSRLGSRKPSTTTEVTAVEERAGVATAAPEEVEG
jgi:hypothetical protein